MNFSEKSRGLALKSFDDLSAWLSFDMGKAVAKRRSALLRSVLDGRVLKAESKKSSWDRRSVIYCLLEEVCSMHLKMTLQASPLAVSVAGAFKETSTLPDLQPSLPKGCASDQLHKLVQSDE